MRERLDFIVIGAHKSGTSSVFEHLRVHPEPYIPPDKELPYFNHDEVHAVVGRHTSRAHSAERPTGPDGTVTRWYMIGCPVDSEGALAAAGHWAGRGPARRDLADKAERIIRQGGADHSRTTFGHSCPQ
jgi:hypothetical protein